MKIFSVCFLLIYSNLLFIFIQLNSAKAGVLPAMTISPSLPPLLRYPVSKSIGFIANGAFYSLLFDFFAERI